MKPEPKIENISALILAGGKGSRIGREKAMLELAGRPLVEHAIKSAANVFEKVYLSGPPELESMGLPVVPDRHQGVGPLAGILSGLEAVTTPWLFALPCDSPFIPEAFFRGMAALISDHEVVVPMNQGFYEPTHALYSKVLVPLMEKLIDSGERKIKLLYAAARVREAGDELIRQWDPDGMAFFNINTAEDLARAEEYIRPVSAK